MVTCDDALRGADRRVRGRGPVGARPRRRRARRSGRCDGERTRVRERHAVRHAVRPEQAGAVAAAGGHAKLWQRLVVARARMPLRLVRGGLLPPAARRLLHGHRLDAARHQARGERLPVRAVLLLDPVARRRPHADPRGSGVADPRARPAVPCDGRDQHGGVGHVGHEHGLDVVPGGRRGAAPHGRCRLRRQARRLAGRSTSSPRLFARAPALLARMRATSSTASTPATARSRPCAAPCSRSAWGRARQTSRSTRRTWRPG